MISFVQGYKYITINKNQNIQPNGKILYLLDPTNDFKILELIPKTFVISTLNGSSKFNTKLLKKASPVIHEILKNDSKIRQYKLNLQDPKNVLGKLEELFQGKFVFFKEDELPIIQNITDLLQITRCPKYMRINKATDEKGSNQELQLFNGVVMNPNYDSFLASKIPNSFTIITNKKEYKCNNYGIYSSKLIRDLLRTQPNLKEYKYDFDDDCDEFQQICDIFNFQKITITPDNMDVLKEISEHFQIDYILTSINKFIQNQESVSQKIEDDQNSVDLIDQLFEWLYNIKELTVETVKSSIVESAWSKTDDDVRELAAFLLQVINNEISIHDELIELIISLNDQLKLLIPFLVQKLMKSFGSSFYNCSFVYKLYKRNIIEKEKLNEMLIQKVKNVYNDIYDNTISWFLPELVELNLLHQSKLQSHSRKFVYNYIQSFLPDRIEFV